MALFGKRPSPYYGKNSSNNQRETTVQSYFKTCRSVNLENVKNFESFFKCSSMKLAFMRTATATGKEDPEFSAEEDTFIRVNWISDCSPNKCFSE